MIVDERAKHKQALQATSEQARQELETKYRADVVRAQEQAAATRAELDRLR